MSRVVVFTTPACSWCRRAKKYLKESRVPFKEINIEKDPSAARDVQRKTGQMGVPVIKSGASGSSASTRRPSTGSWPARPRSSRGQPVNPDLKVGIIWSSNSRVRELR